MDTLHHASKMRMRDATLRDIPRLVEIWITAFLADSSYDAVFPWRNERPDDYQRLWTTKITSAFLQGAQRYLVVETDVVDSNGRLQTEIVGWTSWTRNGSSQAAQKIRANNKTILKGIQRRLRRLEQAMIYPVFRFLRRSYEEVSEGPVAMKYNGEYRLFLERFWIGDIEEHWHMEKLSVDHKWQRNGIGRMLLQWGLDRAQEENIAVGLESTEAGEALYRKAGFVKIGTFEMLEEGITFPILLRRPKTVG